MQMGGSEPRYTKRAQEVISWAKGEARVLGSPTASTVHLLLSMFRDKTCVASRILLKMAVDVDAIVSVVESEAYIGPGISEEQEIELDDGGWMVLDTAYSESKKLRNNYVGTEHLLLGIVLSPNGTVARLLSSAGVQYSDVYAEVLRFQVCG